MNDIGINLDQLDGGGLRKELEKVLAANRELRDKVTGFEQTQRVQQVESYLSSQGLNPKLAKFVPAEAADPKAIDGWVTENAELFGAPKSPDQQSQQAPPAPESTQSQPNIEAGAREAWTRIERVAADGRVMPVDVAALESQLQQAKNPGELMALMRQYEIS